MALSEKSQKIFDFRRLVRAKPQLHWVYEIRKLRDRNIAAWVASVVWWNSKDPRNDGQLFEMTRDHVPAKTRGRDLELNQALNKIGLPSL